MVDARETPTRRSNADPPVSTGTSGPNCCLAMPVMAGEGTWSSVLGPHRTFHDRSSTNRSTNFRQPMPRLPDLAPAPPAATQHAAHARASPPTTDQKVRGVRDLRARLISGWAGCGRVRTTPVSRMEYAATAALLSCQRSLNSISCIHLKRQQCPRRNFIFVKHPFQQVNCMFG